MLTTNNPTYSENCHRKNHIDTIVEVEVFTMGLYSFLVNSSFNLYISLHKEYYDPTSTTTNLHFKHYGPCRAYKFQFTTYLQSNIKYILVMRAIDLESEGLLSVLITGPNNVSLKSIG